MVRKGALGVRIVKIWRDANWMRNEFGDSRKKERKKKKNEIARVRFN